MGIFLITMNELRVIHALKMFITALLLTQVSFSEELIFLRLYKQYNIDLLPFFLDPASSHLGLM